MLSKTQADAANKLGTFGEIPRTLAKLCFAVATVAAVLPAVPSHAENFAFVSANGGGTACTAAAPCKSIGDAFGNIAAPIRIICLSGSQPTTSGIGFGASVSVDIDCPLGFEGQIGVGTAASNVTMRLRHLEFRNIGFSNQIIFQGAGTLILEDCVFTDVPGVALDLEPNGPLNVVIKNSRISNAGSGILLKPAAGGSIKATLDHVTITGNGGGGIKTDSTNGIVNLDITDSEISNNAANGINLVGSANQNMLNLSRTVIAKNTLTGLQTNGAAAAALVETTLFDTNGAGATTVVNGGHVLTYGNNRIVGTAGSGFTGSASLQ
jgi:hypothetical protein